MYVLNLALPSCASVVHPLRTLFESFGEGIDSLRCTICKPRTSKAFTCSHLACPPHCG